MKQDKQKAVHSTFFLQSISNILLYGLIIYTPIFIMFTVMFGVTSFDIELIFQAALAGVIFGILIGPMSSLIVRWVRSLFGENN